MRFCFSAYLEFPPVYMEQVGRILQYKKVLLYIIGSSDFQ